MTYKVETQCWKHWPKTIVVRSNDDEVRHYVPERKCRPMMRSEYSHADYYTTDWAVCSACGGSFTDMGLGVGFVTYKFCPWCGAKVVN